MRADSLQAQPLARQTPPPNHLVNGAAWTPFTEQLPAYSLESTCRLMDWLAEEP